MPINWIAVLTNSLWIAGLAVILASFSYYYWLASQDEERAMSSTLALPGFQRLFALGLILIGAGLATTSKQAWETALAVMLIIGSLFLIIRLRGE